MPSRPSSPSLLGTDIASRIKARFSRSRPRRRRSVAPSLTSSRSDADGISSTTSPSQLPHEPFSTLSEPPRHPHSRGKDIGHEDDYGSNPSSSNVPSNRTSNEDGTSDSKIGWPDGGAEGQMQVLSEEPELSSSDGASHGRESLIQPTNRVQVSSILEGNAADAASGTRPATTTTPAVVEIAPSSSGSSTSSSSGSSASSSSSAANPSTTQPQPQHSTQATAQPVEDPPEARPTSAGPEHLQQPAPPPSARQESTSTLATSSTTTTSSSSQTETPDADLLKSPTTLTSTANSRIVLHDAPQPVLLSPGGNRAASTLHPPSPTEYSSSSRSRSLDPHPPPSPLTRPPSSPASPISIRRQSLLPTRQGTFIESLLQQQHQSANAALGHGPVLFDAEMVTRKIWVKRPNASPTLITINEDDLVDDVRDMILRKYANSLGRTFDSPDLTLRINPREQQQSNRLLGPEEHMCRTLDAYFPGGQTVDEALVIDIPYLRRTPRPSPRAPLPPHTVAGGAYHGADDGRPSENGEGYFPPVGGVPSPHLPLSLPAPTNGTAAPHSIAVLGTGHIPLIPSPGRSRAYRDRPDRPRLGRTHTSSPTILNNGQPNPAAVAAISHGMHRFSPPASHSRTHSHSSDAPGMPPAPPPLPTSPGPDPTPTRVATPPPPRPASPRPTTTRPKKSKKIDHPSATPGLLNGGVPPISVLIVEDNPINLKLLEAFVKRLKVRWRTAMNGRDAVTKWRTGGFHLVLMDIQLPGMNGLEATREIRRLERVNSIGVFSMSSGNATDDASEELKDEDRLKNISMFKSPVIIVALTASSLQSDRHEALAAGCNDFLTKPVNFVWLERKVMEWGCMQALIDFDGWRKWKDFSQQAQDEEAKKTVTSKIKKKNRSSLSSSTGTN
ncbi:hypothetical protein S7711_01853 [Stachybotrys chartarum IBT 7711]|uniref:Uncharacterized protein n=1 Tax=Stachybotrys chartarum (strain CBS 109288 / IBT 7711) TaxID=1280523 RepID=A0A084AJ63_STACB|nr:hypothetical protein S7711_01853 [Stachybotrys chartarum IBT 7711]